MSKTMFVVVAVVDPGEYYSVAIGAFDDESEANAYAAAQPERVRAFTDDQVASLPHQQQEEARSRVGCFRYEVQRVQVNPVLPWAEEPR